MILKIHSKYYDLSQFNHPAGNIPLALGKDRDATELFESHHLLSDKNKLFRIMEKYEIKTHDYILDNNIFDWNESINSEFSIELKDILNNHLSYQSMKSTYKHCLTLLLLFSMYVFNLYMYLRHDYIALMLYPFSLWIFTVNIYHDSLHFALSHCPLINRLGGYTAIMFSLTYTWFHQHVIGHHPFVNIIGKDPDLYHSPKYVRHTPDIRKNKYHPFQHITNWVLWFLAVPIGLILTGSIKTLNNKPYNKVVSLSHSKYLHPSSIYPEFTFVLFYMFFMPLYFTCDIFFVVYPYLIYSFIFMFFTQMNHLTPKTFQSHKNFYIHQIINSHNIAPHSYVMYLISGGLNMQIEHHLIPSCNSCNLYKIQPHIQKLCKKHGIQYEVSYNYLQAFNKYLQHILSFRN